MAKNVLGSSTSYTGDAGTSLFSINFALGIINVDQIKVYLDDVLKTNITDYTIVNNNSQVQFTTAPSSGVTIDIRREQDDNSAEVDYQDTKQIKEKNLDDSNKALYYLLHELFDGWLGNRFKLRKNLNANNKRIINIKNATASQDVPSYQQVLDIVNGGSVTLTSLEYDTIAEMKPVNLSAGILVQTRGYYTLNDKGGSTYLIVAPSTADGYLDHTLDNGNVARLVHDSSITAYQAGMLGDGVTDITAHTQSIMNNTDVSKITFLKGSYYLAGGANSVLIDRSDLEVVLAVGSTLIQDSTGAMFVIGSLGSISNIIFTGKGGKIRNPVSNHASETTGFLLGGNGYTLDGLTIQGLDIYVSKYGIVSNGTSVTLTNMVVTKNKIIVNFAGWGSGAGIGQPFDMNLPSVTGSTAIITENYFKLINSVTTKGDVFKWTSGVLNFSDNQCVLDGAGQTIAVFSKMYQGSKISDSSFKGVNRSGTLEDALQLNASTGAVFSNLTGITGGTSGGGVQIGDNTDCEIKNIVTDSTIRQTSGTTCTDCIIDGFVATQIVFTEATAAWNGGAIKNGTLTGQCYITSQDCDIESITADLGGTANRTLYIKGDKNRVRNYTGKNNISTKAIQIEGDDNILTSITLDEDHSAWEVVSGDSNSIGRISFTNPTSTTQQTYTDNGTNTAYVHKAIGGLTGSITIAIPHNPSGETFVEITFLSGTTTVTNITGAKDKDRVILYLTGASNSLTFDRTNAKLAGGVNFVGNQWDTLTLVYDESSSVWVEQSRSINS